MGSSTIWKRLESLGVFLVALHSLIIGIGLIAATEWILDFAGWGPVAQPFFPRQSGVFHIIIAVGYWWEYRRHGTIGLLVLAKACAVVFLLVMSPWKEAWSVPFSGITDGLMMVGMLVVHRMAQSKS
jgi:hypothetical protein